jgi:hypothetical protein
MLSTKEKRTKEQVLRLLDRAMEQEETLLENVKKLEADLSECRKKVTNPRHELEEMALPASKVSFRLDYYKTEEHAGYKGIIEHLSSRECRTFNGTQLDPIGEFVSQYVREGNWSAKHAEPESPALPLPEVPGEKVEAVKKERSPLLKRLLPEIFGSPAQDRPSKGKLTSQTRPVEALTTQPFWVIKPGSETPQRAIIKGQPMQILIPMPGLEVCIGQPCSVILTAISLEKKPQQTFHFQENGTPDQEKLKVTVRHFALDAGTYRLEVSMTLRAEPKQCYYKAHRLLIVQ